MNGPASIAGDQLTLTGVGQVTVRALQPGNAHYRAATADLTFTAMPDGTINQAPTVTTATNLVFMSPNSSLTIAYQVSDPDSTLDLSGIHVSSPITFVLPDSPTNIVVTGGPVPPGTIGTIEVTVTPAPVSGGTIPLIFVVTDGYNYATNTLTLNVGSGGFVIFAQPANTTAVVGGRATFNVIVGGSGSVTYQWQFMGTNIPGATEASLTLTNIQPSQAGPYSVVVGDSAGIVLSTAAILSVSTVTTPTITWTDPAPLTYGTPLGPTQLSAAANVPGTFAYSPAAGTVLNAGSNQVLKATFTPLDTNNYATASATVNITVLPATPLLTWTNPAPIYYGTLLGSNQLSASANVPGTFAYSPTNGALLNSGTNTLSAVFTPTDSTDYSSVNGSVSLAVLFLYDGVNLSDPAQAQADLDGDGLSNLAEYALGTDPHNPADAQQGYAVSFVNRGGTNYLSMQFRRRRDTTAFPIQYVPEVSADRQTWFSDSAHVLPLSTNALDSQFDRVTVQEQTPTTTTAPRFVRLRIHTN